MINAVRNIIVGLGLLGAVVSIGAFFSPYHQLPDLLSHFRMQYIALILVPLLVAAVSRCYVAAVVLSLCMLAHVATVAHSALPVGEKLPPGDQSIRIMSSNLLASNSEFDEYVSYIESVNPDVIVFQEYTYRWQAAISGKLAQYEFREEVLSSDSFGIALYSKLPLQNTKALNLVREGLPSIQGEIVLAEKTLRILGTHPPPPVSSALYDIRNQQLERMTAWVRESANPSVVVGDLNITPWSYHFRKFLKDSGLKNPRKGTRLLHTWPADAPLLSIPIDHILISDEFQITSMDVSDGLASDHRALWADVHFIGE